MKSFTKPINLNGAELRIELQNAGIVISDDFNAVAEENNILLLDIADKDESLAQTVVAAHNGTIIAPEPTIEDKLKSVGLNLTDLKNALGIQHNL